MIRSGLPASRNAAMVIMAIWSLVLAASIGWFANRLASQPEPSTSASPVQSRVQAPGKQKRNENSRERSRDRERPGKSVRP